MNIIKLKYKIITTKTNDNLITKIKIILNTFKHFKYLKYMPFLNELKIEYFKDGWLYLYYLKDEKKYRFCFNQYKDICVECIRRFDNHTELISTGSFEAIKKHFPFIFSMFFNHQLYKIYYNLIDKKISNCYKIIKFYIILNKIFNELSKYNNNIDIILTSNNNINFSWKKYGYCYLFNININENCKFLKTLYDTSKILKCETFKFKNCKYFPGE